MTPRLVAGYVSEKTHEIVNGCSAVSQVERLEAYAKAHGDQLVACYTDILTEDRTRRYALELLVGDAERGMFEAVLIACPWRLAEGVWAVVPLAQVGVKIQFLTDGAA
jgi:hypothetical protein